jgi:hypothetical protein
MSDMMTTMTPNNEVVKALRAEIIGDYRPFGEIAAALECCVRTVHNLVARHNIAVRKINNVPHAKPADFRRALLGEPGPSDPPPRGRPRKAARP